MSVSQVLMHSNSMTKRLMMRAKAHLLRATVIVIVVIVVVEVVDCAEINIPAIITVTQLDTNIRSSMMSAPRRNVKTGKISKR